MSVRLARALGIAIVVFLGTAASLPSNRFDHKSLQQRFSFTSKELAFDSERPRRAIREVHPSLSAIAPWISSVGGAAAVGDIDGNLKSDDVCIVDTQTDAVVLRPLIGEDRATWPRPVVLVPPMGTEAARTIAPMGCLIADLNEDGLPDVLVYYWGRTPVAFLRIDKGARTLELPLEAGAFRAVPLAPEQRWFTNAALLADVDGDGHLDLVVGNYFCDDGRILDSRTRQPVCPEPVMQDSMSRAFNGGVNRILLWSSGSGGTQPEVLFSEVANVFTPEVARGWTLAIGAHDLNGDRLPDFYFANDFGPDRLLINCSRAMESFGKSRSELGCFPLEGPLAFRLLEGRRTLWMPRSKTLGKDSFKGMGVEFGDLNRDGYPDIYVSNITEKWALQESQFMFLNDGRRLDAQLIQAGEAPFVDHSEQLGLSRSGWAWDAKLADFDNDGKLEALQAVGFVRGKLADYGLAWRKSCWARLQELATANDLWLKYPVAWFDMHADASGKGCDLSGNSRRNAFFVEQQSGRFIDVSDSLPHLAAFSPAPTRGLAIADTDLDGRLDYVEARQFAAPIFHRNTSLAAENAAFLGLSPRFLVFQLGQGELDRAFTADQLPERLPRTRPAMSMHVLVRLSDGRHFELEADGGNGHSGKRSPDLHFGLGAVPAGTMADLEFSWRSHGGVVRTAHYEKVPVNHHYFVFLQP